MNEFLKQLLSLSLSGSLLFLLLLLLKKLYKNRLSKCWQYYIYLAAVLRFLVPFVPDAAHFPPVSQPSNHAGLQFSSHGPAAKEPSRSGQADRFAGLRTSTSGLLPVLDFGDTAACLFFIWLVSALGLLLKKIASYHGFVRYIRTAGKTMDETGLLDLLASCEEACRVKRPVELYYIPHLLSPVMTGFFHPCIAIPDKKLPEKDLSLIFTHELYHYRRRDMFYKWLIQTVVCIHWFNPLVYLLEKEVSLACELSCDEAVIHSLPAEEKKAYGNMLLNCSRAALFQKTSASSLTLAEGAKQLKERLGAIMRYKHPTKKTKLAAASLTAAVCFGSTIIGAYAAPARPMQTQNQTAVLADMQAQNQTDPKAEPDSYAAAITVNTSKNIVSDKLPDEVKTVLSLKVNGYESYTLKQFSDYIGQRYEADHSLWKARQHLWEVLDEGSRQNLSEADYQFLHTTLPCTESESAYPKDRTGSIPPDFSSRYELPYAKHHTTIGIEWSVRYKATDPKLTVGQRDRLILNVKNGMEEYVKTTWETADIGSMDYLKNVRSRLDQLVKENSGSGLKMTVFHCLSDGKSA